MKVLVLGSTGFVGRNLIEVLSPELDLIKVSRQPSDASYIHFDLQNRASWQPVVDRNPDVIINAAAYGVVKHEQELTTMYQVNYLLIADFQLFLKENNCHPFWIQVGTAFEYDLSIAGGITEKTPCLPRTHYGISKLMFSKFLQEKSLPGQYCIFRPFGMFGKYEDESKFFPMLIKAQQNQQTVKLSAGTQERDYFCVSDLATFIKKLIQERRLQTLPGILNLGSGEARSFKYYSEILSSTIPNYDPSLWQWNALDFRANESALFYNSSGLAAKSGFRPSELREAFSETTTHYYTR